MTKTNPLREQGVAFTKACIDQQKWGHVAYFWVGVDKTDKYKVQHNFCHANLSAKVGPTFVVNWIGNKTEEARRFIEHVLDKKKSPYRSILKNVEVYRLKEHDNIPLSIFVKDTKKVYAKLLKNFFICLRMPSEKSHRIKTWCVLVDKGIDPNLALFLISSITIQNDKVYKQQEQSHWYISGLGYYHYYDAGAMFNLQAWLNGTPNQEAENFYHRTSTYEQDIYTVGNKAYDTDIWLTKDKSLGVQGYDPAKRVKSKTTSSRYDVVTTYSLDDIVADIKEQYKDYKFDV